MTFTLRPYQEHAEQQARIALAGGNRRIVLYLPTGGGKTLTATSIITKAVTKGRRVVFIANRKQLVSQTSAVLHRYGIDHGILQAENTCRLHERVLVASIDTVHVRGLPDDVGLLIIDECHAVAGSQKYRALLARYNLVPVVGLTATPFAVGMAKQYDDIGGPLFEHLVVGATIGELIEQGHLVDVDTYAPSEPDLKGLKCSKGIDGILDYKQSDLEEAADKPSMAATGPLDSHGNSMAATNELKAQLEEMTRTQPANVTMIENSGLKETQALMDKWGRQAAQREMLQEMSRNPKAAGAIASLYAAGNQAEAQVRGQDMAEAAGQRANDTTQRGQDIAAETTRRGQDVHAQGEANRLAGNPLSNELTRVKIDSERVATDRARSQNNMLAQLQTEIDPATRETLIENALVSQGKAPQQGERLTLPERRGNLEIDAARKAIAGLSPEDIRRKTAKQTDTGRENPDFDPALERAVSLAARRKIGDDPVFDQRQAQPAQPATQPAGDVSARFTADPSMKSHRLGKQTELGTEVFDASGKLIGHYR